MKKKEQEKETNRQKEILNSNVHLVLDQYNGFDSDD